LAAKEPRKKERFRAEFVDWFRQLIRATGLQRAGRRGEAASLLAVYSEYLE
jgi:hypothetical protein